MSVSKCAPGAVLGLVLAVVHPGWSAEEGDTRARAIIRPSVVQLDPGGRQAFRVALLATYLEPASSPKTIEWSVDGIPGGSPERGTIDGSGLYTAPGAVPTPHEVHIGARVEEARNPLLWATVLVGESPDPPYRRVGEWSEAIGEDSRLRDPHGVALDPAGHLVIVDEASSRVLRYTREGDFIDEIGGGPGNGPGHFAMPRAVLVDREDRIWVSDTKGDEPRLQVFDADGTLLRVLGQKGIGPGQLLRPHGMGFDGEERLFVVDVDNFRVNVYGPDGGFVKSWGRPGAGLGELNAPHGLFVDPSGDVFVTGYYGPTQKFDGEGRLLGVFAHGDPPDGPVNFHALVGDRWGDVYLMVRRLEAPAASSDGSPRRLDFVKLNNNGDPVAAWALSEPDRHGSWAVVDDDGTVYALFRGETRAGVEIFEPR
jgi:hypothetical protein